MYALELVQQEIKRVLRSKLGDFDFSIERPPKEIKADLAVPIFEIAKKIGKNPEKLSQEISQLNFDKNLMAKTEAQKGFINFFLNPLFLANAVLEDFKKMTEKYGGPEKIKTQTIVIDYSSPNAAKEMHVGHLRSTIIGDSLRRLLIFFGHKVISQNHLGDWGTQFGMLIEYLLEEKIEITKTTIADLDEYYQKAKKRYDADKLFAQKSRQRTVLLQSRDKLTTQIWQNLIEKSLKHFNEIYQKLGVLLTDKDIKAESQYQNAIPDIIAELKNKKIITVSEEALGFFPDNSFPPSPPTGGFGEARKNKISPLIIQKSDTGFTYAAADLAALKYRAQTLKADKILYVVDFRQTEYFKTIFEIAKRAGWITNNQAVHISFGSILDKNGRPFKTREGGTIKLKELLEEAEQRALKIIQEKNPNLSRENRFIASRKIGIAAIKYADLSSDRNRDYIFDWNKLLNFEGNTAPYLQYAAVRAKAILDNFGKKIHSDDIKDESLIHSEQEINLIKSLAEFPPALETAVNQYKSHYIVNCLYKISQNFNLFYEAVPVLKTKDEKTRNSRLYLCQKVYDVLKTGLAILGIECPAKM